MFVKIPKLLSDADLAKIDKVIASGTFLDGAATTGNATKPVKHNVQLDLAKSPRKEDLLEVLNRTMNVNSTVRAAILPRRMSVPLVSKYSKGMSYGWHVDNAIMMGAAGPLRTDVACTVFLSNSADYDGGELVLSTSSGDLQVKLDRGDAFLYPAISRHQVKEVTSGERVAIVMWIQSMVADASKREILYDLELSYDRLRKENPASEAIQYLQRTQANLVRRWSEV